MKYLIASDIHGSAYWTERLVAAIESEQPDRIVLLGDLLYHGPRNDLPRDYAPKRVIPLLNALADRIIAVRGNCDAEVDQMVLDFPVMADYATLFDEAGRELFLTHGHVFGAGMHNSVDHVPALPEGSALVYGHTHIKVNEASEARPGLWLFNPGSVSIPKDGTHSYGIYEGGAFRHVILEENPGGEIIMAQHMARQNAEGSRDLSTLVDVSAELQHLVQTIWRLRQPDGCPWDREQTHRSIGKNMIEEAYEALDCIEADDVAHLREELGDVLMQVVLHAQIAADAGEFTLADVARDIDAKLIRRHPHVFGDADAESSDEVLKIWDEVKLAEKAAKDKAVAAGEAAPEGLLDGVPTHLPALMQAQKVSRKAAAVGFEWETVQDVWDEVAEERAEFEAETPGSPEREMEFGDLLFALVNVARKEGIDAESALRASTAKFRRRWAAMEQMAADAHVDLAELSTHGLNDLWDAAKAEE